MDEQEREWRKAIAEQVRRSCTPSSEAYARGGDFLVFAVADWIETPPEWAQFDAPGRPKQTPPGPPIPPTPPPGTPVA